MRVGAYVVQLVTQHYRLFVYIIAASVDAGVLMGATRWRVEREAAAMCWRSRPAH